MLIKSKWFVNQWHTSHCHSNFTLNHSLSIGDQHELMQPLFSNYLEDVYSILSLSWLMLKHDQSHGIPFQFPACTRTSPCPCDIHGHALQPQSEAAHSKSSQVWLNEQSPSWLAIPVVNSSPKCSRGHTRQQMQTARDPFGIVLYMTSGMASPPLPRPVTLSPCCRDGNEAADKVTQKFFWLSGNWTVFQSPSTLRSFAPITFFSCSHRTTSHFETQQMHGNCQNWVREKDWKTKGEN